LFIKYVLEYPLAIEDMIGLIPYPGVLLIGYRPMFMYPVRPFTTCFKCVARASFPYYITLCDVNGNLRSPLAV
jgi:hypothetical protein